MKYIYIVRNLDQYDVIEVLDAGGTPAAAGKSRTIGVERRYTRQGAEQDSIPVRTAGTVTNFRSSPKRASSAKNIARPCATS